MSEENQENYQPQPESPTAGNKGRNVLIIILVLLLIGAGFKFYRDYQQKEVLNTELNSTVDQLDSIRTQLDQKIAKIQELGGDITDLQTLKKDLEGQISVLKESNQATKKQLSYYREKVSGYTELLKNKDKEIEHLKDVNKQLLTENTGLKQEKNQLNDSISDLHKKGEELQNKVAIASHLKAENIHIYGVNKRGKEREDEFRPRQVEKLKITFSLAENKVAPIGGRDIYIRIMQPNGKVLFDVAHGSGSFTIDGKELFYTAKQEILFDNTKQELTFYYEREKDYEEGVYTVEIYATDYTIGKKDFTVK